MAASGRARRRNYPEHKKVAQGRIVATGKILLRDEFCDAAAFGSVSCRGDKNYGETEGVQRSIMRVGLCTLCICILDGCVWCLVGGV